MRLVRESVSIVKLCLPSTSRPKKQCLPKATTEVVRQVAAAVARPRTRRRAAAAVVAAAVVLAARRAGERGEFVSRPTSDGNSDPQIPETTDPSDHTVSERVMESNSTIEDPIVSDENASSGNSNPTECLASTVNLEMEIDKHIIASEVDEDLPFIEDMVVL